jgi:hypothetical protein
LPATSLAVLLAASLAPSVALRAALLVYNWWR